MATAPLCRTYPMHVQVSTHQLNHLSRNEGPNSLSRHLLITSNPDPTIDVILNHLFLYTPPLRLNITQLEIALASDDSSFVLPRRPFPLQNSRFTRHTITSKLLTRRDQGTHSAASYTNKQIRTPKRSPRLLAPKIETSRQRIYQHSFASLFTREIRTANLRYKDGRGLIRQEVPIVKRV